MGEKKKGSKASASGNNPLTTKVKTRQVLNRKQNDVEIQLETLYSLKCTAIFGIKERCVGIDLFILLFYFL